MKGLFTEDFWNRDHSDWIVYDGNAYLGLGKSIDFEKEIWFELGKAMWRKHQSVNQDHLKYIHNDIVKPFHVGVLCYADLIQGMHNLVNHLPPP